MRKGKPGAWWVLKRAEEPLYWIGELIETTLEGESAVLPVFAVDKAMAQQFCDRAHAMMAHALFGLEPAIVAVELEFVA